MSMSYDTWLARCPQADPRSNLLLFKNQVYIYIDCISRATKLENVFRPELGWEACLSTDRPSGPRARPLGQAGDSAMRLLDDSPPASSLSLPICKPVTPAPYMLAYKDYGPRESQLDLVNG